MHREVRVRTRLLHLVQKAIGDQPWREVVPLPTMTSGAEAQSLDWILTIAPSGANPALLNNAWLIAETLITQTSYLLSVLLRTRLVRSFRNYNTYCDFFFSGFRLNTYYYVNYVCFHPTKAGKNNPSIDTSVCQY